MADEEKVLNPKVERRTVVDSPKAEEWQRPQSNAGFYVFQVAQAADEITPWGMNVALRDLELRSFYPQESLLASTIYTMTARLAVADWGVKGRNPDIKEPRNTIRAVERMLWNADRGMGWQSFIIKLATDLYTADNGAFIELIRTKNSPAAPVIGVAHLDSASCQRTGDPKTPVIYTDRMGRLHKLNWWSVRALAEMPTPVESMFGAQLCAVSRCLRAAQIIRDISIYTKEKVSGQHTKSIHFVSGVTNDDIQNAIVRSQEEALNRALSRYILPTIVATIDPQAGLNIGSIDMASLPDNFDEDTAYRWYVTQVALAFGTDYQEIAPLPGGSLGNSTQSLVMHMKAKGKGPTLLINLLEYVFNETGILPPSVVLKFKVSDAQLDAARAEARFNRGKDRVLRLKAGELDEKAARELAIEDGDLPEYMAADLAKRDEERERKAEQISQEQTQQQQEENPDQLQAEQVEGGIQSHEERKQFDDEELAELLLRLQKRGDLKLPKELPELPEEKEFTALGTVRRLGDTLEATVHQYFTEAADNLLKEGYLSREERIQLSSAIGRALQTFNEQMPEGVGQRDLDTRPRYTQMIPEAGRGEVQAY